MTLDGGSLVVIGLVVLFLGACVINMADSGRHRPVGNGPEPVYTEVRATPAGHHALVSLYQGSDGYWTMFVTHTDGESFAQHLCVHDSTTALISDANSFWEGVAHTLIADYDYVQSQRG